MVVLSHSCDGSAFKQRQNRTWDTSSAMHSTNKPASGSLGGRSVLGGLSVSLLCCGADVCLCFQECSV